MDSVSRPSAQPDSVIRLTAAEIQSGHDRQYWAEDLIVQLPESHDGRNSWLLNYGIRGEARKLREDRGLKFNPRSRAVNPPAPLPHLLSCLPDCMSPDGADPCAGYHAAHAQIEQLYAKLTCCCGSYVADHGMGDGHSPVSMYDHALDQANAEIEQLKRQVEGLETLRPVWAFGHSDASMTAQAASGALAGLWRLLGAKNQTEAVQALRDLPARRCKHFPDADDLCVICNPHKQAPR